MYARYVGTASSIEPSISLKAGFMILTWLLDYPSKNWIGKTCCVHNYDICPNCIARSGHETKLLRNHRLQAHRRTQCVDWQFFIFYVPLGIHLTLSDVENMRTIAKQALLPIGRASPRSSTTQSLYRPAQCLSTERSRYFDYGEDDGDGNEDDNGGDYKEESSLPSIQDSYVQLALSSQEYGLQSPRANTSNVQTQGRGNVSDADLAAMEQRVFVSNPCINTSLSWAKQRDFVEPDREVMGSKDCV